MAEARTTWHVASWLNFLKIQFFYMGGAKFSEKIYVSQNLQKKILETC